MRSRVGGTSGLWSFCEHAKEIAAEMFWRSLCDQIVTKTGIIVGMGEEMHELLAVFRDLADRKVDILTIGQYLRPSRDHLVMSAVLHAGGVRVSEA